MPSVKKRKLPPLEGVRNASMRGDTRAVKKAKAVKPVKAWAVVEDGRIQRYGNLVGVYAIRTDARCSRAYWGSNASKIVRVSIQVVK